MMLEEYNEAEQMELFRRDGVEEGRKEGREEGRKDTTLGFLRHMMEKKNLDIQEAMDLLGIPAEEQSYYINLCENK